MEEELDMLTKNMDEDVIGPELVADDVDDSVRMLDGTE